MGQIVDKKLTRIVTADGQLLIRRVTTVRMDNGKYRYPVDYFDATPGAVMVSEQERQQLSVPGYKQFI